MKWKGLLATSMLLVTLAVFVFPAYVDAIFHRHIESVGFLPNDCKKVWGHRGYTNGAHENTLESVRNAFGHGAAGVEVDILYDVATDRFYVSHDRPYQRVDDKLLTLDELFNHTSSLGKFWLDAKDLEDLLPWHAKKATARLVLLLEKHHLKDRAFVESRNPWYLAWLRDKGVYTSLMISPNEEKYADWIYYPNITLMKFAYSVASLHALSMSDSRYLPKTIRAFNGAPVLLSTVNEFDDIKRLSQDSNVRIILSDKNYFSYDSCSSP